MATEAATGQPANVQAYLSKHSISTLFEDLTALLVKELPDNPIDFLILKLQAKKKKTIGTSRSGPSVTGPKKLDVTGTSAPKTERSKPPGKPTSVKSTTSATKPATARPTTGPSSRPSSSKPATTATKEQRTTATKSAPAGVTKVTKPTAVKPTATSGVKKPVGTTKPSAGTKTAPASSTPRRPAGKSTGIPTKGGATPKGTKTPSDSPSITRKAPPKPVAVVTEPPPPTTCTQAVSESTVSSKEEEEEEEMRVDTKVTYDDSEEEEEEGHHQEHKDTPVELNQLISQLKRSKHPRKMTQDKTHLTVLINAQAGVSEGYISDNEEESESEELEVVESIDALEEEGVYLTGEARKMSLKLPSVGPAIDLQVQICARCAKVMSRDEVSTTVSSSIVSKLTSVDEFESASQVATSQTTYPQWDTEESGSLTVKQKWAAAGPVSDGASISSHDTWKGLAPVSREEGQTDEESELQLPQPVDYHKPEEDTTEREESSLIED